MARNDLITIHSPDAEQALESLRDTLALIPGGMTTAARRALAKTTKGMRTDATRKVREEYNLPQRRARDAFSIEKPERVSDRIAARLVGTSEKSTPLYDFGAKPSVPKPGKGRPKKGVAVQVKKAGGWKTVDGAFVAEMRSGHKGIFERLLDNRLPVLELYGPGPLQAINDEVRLADLQDLAEERLRKNMLHEAEFALQQAGLR